MVLSPRNGLSSPVPLVLRAWKTATSTDALSRLWKRSAARLLAKEGLPSLPAGPKHKHGDIDRECMYLHLRFGLLVPDLPKLVTRALVNRFAGTRIEDLQGEIPSLCED